MEQKKKLQTLELAHFALSSRFEDIPQDVADQLKKHLLDSIGSLIHATGRPTIQKLATQITSLGEGGSCLTPLCGKIAWDRAAQLYTALIRYPDFMDNFLGKEATCHPSDNIGPLLAASQMQPTTGKEFLTAMAIAYEIECRLVQETPVMVKGFDHTLLLAYSVTAALSRMLGLTEEQTAHALGIAGCSQNPLVTCRASYTYEWKGLASSLVAMNCMNICLLAKGGLTGPIEIFNGPKGFNDVFDMELKYDWHKEDFSLIRKCILKEFNSEVHTQSVLEAALELKRQHRFKAEEIAQINVTTFLTCYHIVGGGMYGDRHTVHSKEQADHSLPYTLAALMTDNELYPEQFIPERINKADVQTLSKRVSVGTALPLHTPVVIAGAIDPYTSAYPERVPARVEITLMNGKTYSVHKDDYYGFFTRPLSWEDTEKKFRRLTKSVVETSMQNQLINLIRNLEKEPMTELIELLATCK